MTAPLPLDPDELPGDGSGPNWLLDGLNDAQRTAVTHPSPCLCILAGAGSGKTRVLTRRIAWRVAIEASEAGHVLALTFTRRAAAELSSRLGRLGIRRAVMAGTFHSVALAQLRHRWADLGETPPALLERKGRILGPLLPRQDRGAPSVTLGDVAAEIEWAKARMIPPRSYESAASRYRRRPSLPPAEVAGIYRQYEREKHRRRLVDFDDLLILAARAIESDETFAASQRWRFRHLYVDEYQDVNPLQHRLLEAWRGDREDLCVVGDPNQAIYAWNGADASFIRSFARDHPAAAQVELEENYRSSPQVLAVANAVLGDSARLKAAEPDGPIPTITSHPSDRSEADAVVSHVRRAMADGRRWSDFVVLSRTHSQLALFEQAFRSARIPFRVRGSVDFLAQPEVAGAVGLLRSSDPDTDMATALVDLEELARSEDPGSESSDGHGASERRARLEALVRMAREHMELSPGANVGAFLAWLTATLRGDHGAEGSADAVEGATLHAAKGLEWPVVFLVGLEQGLLPIGHAETPAEKAEERRLFYVGATRAERELHISWAEKRTFGSRTVGRSPSPYLAPAQGAVAALADGSSGADWRSYVEQGRQALRSRAERTKPTLGTRADPRVLEALRSWRSQVARAAGVPAYVVFHDTTLAAVAEALPSDRESLLALPGVGPVKVERYGADLLSLVARP